MYNPPTNKDYLFALHYSPAYQQAYDEGYYSQRESLNPYPFSYNNVYENQLRRWWKKGKLDSKN